MEFIHSNVALRKSIVDRLGYFPSFFEPALGTPHILDILWNQTVLAYLNSPLPVLFREKLCALLASYSSATYCLSTHNSNLKSLGLNASEIFRLLCTPVPNSTEFTQCIEKLTAVSGDEWPESGTLLEECLLQCCLALFFNQVAPSSIENLEIILGKMNYSYLVLLFAYKRTCFQWVETHPVISYQRDEQLKKDLDSILEEEPALIHFFRDDRNDFQHQEKQKVLKLSQDNRVLLDQRQAFQKKANYELQLVLDNICVFIGILDKNGVIVEMNAPALHMAGSSKEKKLGKVIWEAAWWANLPSVSTRIHQAIQKASIGIPQRFDTLYCSKEHSKEEHRWCDFTARPLFDEVGKIKNIVVSVVDINDRVQTEAKFQTTLSSVCDAVISTTFDVNPLIDFMNSSAQQLTGWTLEEAKGKSIFEIFKIENQSAFELFEKSIQRVIEEGFSKELSNSALLISKNREEFIVEYSASPIRNNRDDILGFVLTFRDVTEKKRSEEQKKLAQKEMIHLLEAMTEGFFSITQKGVITYANHETLRFLGLKEDEIIGKNVTDVFRSEDWQKFMVHCRKTLESGISVRFEEVYEGRVLQVHAHQTKGDGYAVFYRDVTEQRRLETEEKRTSLIIANERENFRNLFRQTPEMVCILFGPEHRFEFVNDAHIKVLGFNATGMTVREAQPESIEIHGILDQVYKTGVTAFLREIPVTLSNRKRYFDLTYAARRNPAYEINGIMILGTEVTEQVLNRTAVRNQKNWLEAVFDQVPTSLLLIDPKNNQITFANAAAKAMIGIPIQKTLPGERYGSAIRAYHSSGRLLSVTEIPSARASRGEEINGEEITLETPMGCFQVSVFSKTLLANYGHEATALLLLQDISKLKQIETALRQSEKQLSTAINVSKVGFYDWDVQKNEIKFSQQMIKDWGIPEVQFCESIESAIEFIHPDDRERIKNLIQSALTEKKTYSTEYRVVHPDGKVIWLEVKGEVLYNEVGVPIRFFGTSLNVTEHKEFQIELEKAKEAAEAANSAKSAFLANMSHEIRTPLGTVMGFADLLTQPNIHPEEIEQYTTVIKRNSIQLLRIIDDILDLSKVEAGRMTIEEIGFSIPEFLSDFSSLMGLRARENGIELELNAATALPGTIYSDPTRIRQILTNVVGNAIKFTEKGKVVLNVSFVQNLLEFKVEDTGCGISEEHSKKLFQPFVQADISTTRKFGGTGLGLVLTKKLCQIFGGDFYLEKSVVGQGSTFVARIKVRTPESASVMSQSQVNSSMNLAMNHNMEVKVLAGMKILLVEDSPDNQALMRIILSKSGALVEMASDGFQGVEMALADEFSVVLMDVQMPKMDGHEATRILRKNRYQKPIIALTAHAMKDEKQKCIESGFSGFLSKPIQRKALIEVLENLYRGSFPFDQGTNL